jgi:hypothetical protein
MQQIVQKIPVILNSPVSMEKNPFAVGQTIFCVPFIVQVPIAIIKFLIHCKPRQCNLRGLEGGVPGCLGPRGIEFLGRCAVMVCIKICELGICDDRDYLGWRRVGKVLSLGELILKKKYRCGCCIGCF